MEIRVLYRDDCLVAAIKPYGVLSEDGDREKGMPALLSQQIGGEVLPVHRLDRTTAGVMVFARTRDAAARLSEAIRRGDVTKTYLAVAEGVTEPGGELSDLLYFDRRKAKSYVVARERKGVKEARLLYERLAAAEYEGRELSLLRVTLLTGRTHQIRVQFASRRHPLVGDRRYGSAVESDRIALCAAELRFPHPVSGEEMRFTCQPEGGVFDLFASY